jgi:hypothetical protein
MLRFVDPTNVADAASAGERTCVERISPVGEDGFELSAPLQWNKRSRTPPFDLFAPHPSARKPTCPVIGTEGSNPSSSASESVTAVNSATARARLSQRAEGASSGYRRGISRPFCPFAGLRSGASSGNVKAVFFSDFGCFGFLASRLDRLCPFAMTSFLALIIPSSGTARAP